MYAINENIKLSQGDVNLYLLSEVAEVSGLAQVSDKILQNSERPGKSHKFKPDSDVDIYEIDGGFLIDVGQNGATLYHGTEYRTESHADTGTDHHALTIPGGQYKVTIVNEFNAETLETLKVID